MPPTTRNMAGSTSSTNNKSELSPGKLNLQKPLNTNKVPSNSLSGSRTVNNSYIEVISDFEELKNTELDLVMDLRDKLAQGDTN